MAKLLGWDFKPSQAGWGTHEAMLAYASLETLQKHGADMN